MPTPFVVTVALNPAIDYSITVEGLQCGAVNRAANVDSQAGGKALNVAACLADVGIHTAVIGLLGRENVQPFEALFHSKPQMENHSCLIDGATRVNTKVIDRLRHETTDINAPGLVFTPESASAALDQVCKRLIPLLATVRWVVLSGSVPPGMPVDIYATLIHTVQDHRTARVLLDSSGAPFRHGLSAQPHIVKPNRHELAEWAGTPLETIAAITDAGQSLRNMYGIDCVAVSLGHDGALFLTAEEIIRVPAPPISVVSTVGAGDAMVAGIIAAQLSDLSWQDTAQRATAFAAAKLTRC